MVYTDTWLNGVHRTCAETTALHMPPAKERYHYTTSVDINNTHYKKLQSLIQNYVRHVHSESAREQRIVLYKSYEY